VRSTDLDSSALQRSILELQLLTIIVGATNQVLEDRKRKHRWWVQDITKQRSEYGAYAHLIRDLQEDEEIFKKYFRLSREQFAQVLFYVGADLVKHCVSREVISPRERLAMSEVSDHTRIL